MYVWTIKHTHKQADTQVNMTCLYDIKKLYVYMIFGGDSGKEPACQSRRCRRHGFDPWVRKTPRRRKWQPTPPVFPGGSHGQRSLVGYSPQGRKESDTSEATYHACTIVKHITNDLTDCIFIRCEKSYICHIGSMHTKHILGGK